MYTKGIKQRKAIFKYVTYPCLLFSNINSFKVLNSFSNLNKVCFNCLFFAMTICSSDSCRICFNFLFLRNLLDASTFCCFDLSTLSSIGKRKKFSLIHKMTTRCHTVSKTLFSLFHNSVNTPYRGTT